ncbi:hypothetical protein D3C73_910180 [compost metagenome]
MLQHLLQRRNNDLLPLPVSILDDADRRARITVAEQDPARLFNLPRALAAARIVESNDEIRHRCRFNTRGDRLPRCQVIAQADGAGVMHDRRTEQRGAGLDGRYSGNHLDRYPVRTVPAAFHQHLIYQSSHSVYSGIAARNDGYLLTCLCPAHRLLGPADFFGHSCAHNLLMFKQRLNQLYVCVIADYGITFLDCGQRTACNLLQGAGAKTDNQQLSLCLHRCSPVHRYIHSARYI